MMLLCWNIAGSFKNTNEIKVLKMYLAYIHANFSFLSQSITKSDMNINLMSEIVNEIGDT
jgi:hypothetical protein